MIFKLQNALNIFKDSITAFHPVTTALLLGGATHGLTGSDYLFWDCSSCFYSLLTDRPIIPSSVRLAAVILPYHGFSERKDGLPGRGNNSSGSRK